MAIETIERSRSKHLVDLMASNDLYSGGEIPPEVQELLRQYEALQKQIDSERFGNNSDSKRGFMETGSRTQNRATFQAYNEAIHNLETEKDQVFEQIRRLDPVLAGEIQVSVPDFAQMQKLIDRPTAAILSFYTTTNNTYIFILRQNQSTPDLHTCEGQGIETLQNWILQKWLQPYCKNKDTWQSQLGDFLAKLAQRLQIDNLITCYLQGIEELILIPHLLLHQIPLAALPIQDTKHSYLGDKFLIRYVPSCQVLEFCQKRENRHPIGGSLNYGIVADATEDLACASFEAEQIAHLFNIPESQHLKGRSQATKSKYRQLASQVQLLHSCHHAESRLDKPLESILKLGDGTLTLAELLTPGWRLPNLSDVFLSCCEANLGFPESLADERKSG
jgi:CHAT domain-containing protein